MREPQDFGYRAEIDGLRAVAVLPVLGFHSFPATVPGGFVGVDVFFVISGFLITGIIVKSLRTQSFSLAQFYARRARRILPALLVVMGACLLFGWFALLPDEYRALSKHVTAAAVFASNFLLWQESGYFDVEAELKPLLHLWSLGIEEQFYLVWPLALLLLWRRARAFWMLIAVALLALLSFVLNLALVHEKPTGTFYFPLTRFWELGIGCLLALVGTARSGIEPGHTTSRWTHALAFAGLAAIVLALFIFDEHTAFPGWAALLPTLGAVCVIAAGRESWLNRHLLSHPAMVFIGLISYPLYLWHWPLLSFANILESGEPPHWIRAGAILVSFPLAWATYHLVELPVRRKRSLRVPLLLAGGTACLGIAASALFAGFLGTRQQYELKMVERGARTDRACLEFFGGSVPFGYCKSTSESPPELLVLGDSHAQAIYEGAVEHIGENRRIMLLADGGCPPLLNADVYPVRSGISDRKLCRQHWNGFVRFVRQVKPSIVVLVGRGPYYFEGDGFEVARVGPEYSSRAAAFEAGLRDAVRALSQHSRVVYVLEHPFFESQPTCFMRPFTLTSAHHCKPVRSRAEIERQMAEYRSMVFDLQREFPELRIIDPLPLFCDARQCYQMKNEGEVFYSDTDHLSLAGGLHLVESSDLSHHLRVALESASGASRG